MCRCYEENILGCAIGPRFERGVDRLQQQRFEQPTRGGDQRCSGDTAEHKQNVSWFLFFPKRVAGERLAALLFVLLARFAAIAGLELLLQGCSLRA